MNWDALLFYRDNPGGVAISLVVVLLAWFGAREMIRRNQWSESTWEYVSFPLIEQWRKVPSFIRYLAGLLIFGWLYCLAFLGGTAFTRPTSAPLWFPDTVLLCALLLTPVRKWWIFLLSALPIRLLVVSRPEHLLWTISPTYLHDSLKALLAAV